MNTKNEKANKTKENGTKNPIYLLNKLTNQRLMALKNPLKHVRFYINETKGVIVMQNMEKRDEKYVSKVEEGDTFDLLTGLSLLYTRYFHGLDYLKLNRLVKALGFKTKEDVALKTSLELFNVNFGLQNENKKHELENLIKKAQKKAKSNVYALDLLEGKTFSMPKKTKNKKCVKRLSPEDTLLSFIETFFK